MRMGPGSLRRVLADRAVGATGIFRRIGRWRHKRAMQAMLGMTKLDIAELRRAYEGKSAA